MISKGSCDTDWTDDDELCVTGINYILKSIQIESNYFKSVIIFHNITLFF